MQSLSRQLSFLLKTALSLVSLCKKRKHDAWRVAALISLFCCPAFALMDLWNWKSAREMNFEVLKGISFQMCFYIHAYLLNISFSFLIYLIQKYLWELRYAKRGPLLRQTEVRLIILIICFWIKKTTLKYLSLRLFWIWMTSDFRTNSFIQILFYKSNQIEWERSALHSMHGYVFTSIIQRKKKGDFV